MKLSSVPYISLSIGFKVRSAIGTSGKIARLFTRECNNEPEWIHIEWDNGNTSTDAHYNFTKVTVDTAEEQHPVFDAMRG